MNESDAAEAVRYTPPVLKGLAWVALIALLTLVCVDRVVCVDGCTESPTGLADGAHSCVLCTSGLDAPVELPTLSPLGIIGSFAVPALPPTTSVPPPILDHPPRSFVS